MNLFAKKAPEPTRQTLVVAGLTVDVHAQPKATRPDAPVAVMFLLHGRNGSAHRMGEYITGIFEEVHARRAKYGGEAQDLFIVTIVSLKWGCARARRRDGGGCDG